MKIGSGTKMMLISVSTGVYSIDLIQPDSVVVQPGQSLTITCQVSGYSLTDNSYATGWIRQREGKLEWIVHQWGGGVLSQNNALKNKFRYSLDSSSKTLFYTAESAQLTSVSFIQCSVKNVLCLYSWYFNRTFVFPFLATSTGPTVFPLRPCSSGTGDMVSLGCLATGFTPSSLTFTWDKNGAALTDFIQYPPVQKGNVYTGVTQIQVRRQDWNDKANFKCVATHPAGTDGAIVAPPPPPPQCNAPDVELKIEGPKVEDLFLHGKGTITCKVNGQGVDKMFWEDQYGNEMPGALQGPFNGKPLSLPLDISYDEWNIGVKRYCVVEHENFQEPLKKLYERNIETLRPSVFMLPPVEHTRTETVTLTCYVKDFSPHEVFVSWLVDDEAASASKYEISTTNPVKNNGSYSVYGQLSLSLDEWKNNNMVYSLSLIHILEKDWSGLPLSVVDDVMMKCVLIHFMLHK
uniref:Ig-like domain-containing protein n=1 Tax=Seriola lalandi dorsalis TaxID=1841481 RepID=A0A3B4XBB0_SERLL